MRKVLEIVAMMMIGDGVLSLLRPQSHVQLWRNGPQGYQNAMDEFLKRPGLTRTLGALEIGLALWLAFREEP